MSVNPLDLLLALVDQGYDHTAWHGPNLRGAIRRVTLDQVCYRPAPDRHNIWEIVVHAAYWKYTIRRRLLKEKRGSFPLKGSSWFVRPEAVTRESWQTDVQLLDSTHKTMRAAIAGFEVKRLQQAPPGSKSSYLNLIAGIAAHDVYHAGQIQLLKRLAGAGEES